MSAASDAFEKAVMTAIDGQKYAAVQGRDVRYSDVKVTDKKANKTAWVEVKMSHSDNLSNPRVFYKDGKWQTTYTTPAAIETIKVLNTSTDAAKFITNIAKFSGIPEKVIIIGTNKSHLKLPGCVPLHVMKEYFNQPGVNRYIATESNKNIGDLVTRHYLEGKAAPAEYLQAGNDFYMIGTRNPLKLSNKIPVLSGTGDFKVRVSTRSEFYEVQAEIKIKDFSPKKSQYSVLPDSGKINPFEQ